VPDRTHVTFDNRYWFAPPFCLDDTPARSPGEFNSMPAKHVPASDLDVVGGRNRRVPKGGVIHLTINATAGLTGAATRPHAGDRMYSAAAI
jgi:hypothetical protein